MCLTALFCNYPFPSFLFCFQLRPAAEYRESQHVVARSGLNHDKWREISRAVSNTSASNKITRLIYDELQRSHPIAITPNKEHK